MGIEQSGGVVYGVIHFSAEFPVVATACGARGPSAALWRYVDCEACLEAGPDDDRIRERLEAVRAARAAATAPRP
jgi:predicted aldo/keto reductase-like oxidoreductase